MPTPTLVTGCRLLDIAWRHVAPCCRWGVDPEHGSVLQMGCGPRAWLYAADRMWTLSLSTCGECSLSHLPPFTPCVHFNTQDISCYFQGKPSHWSVPCEGCAHVIEAGSLLVLGFLELCFYWSAIPCFPQEGGQSPSCSDARMS